MIILVMLDSLKLKPYLAGFSAIACISNLSSLFLSQHGGIAEFLIRIGCRRNTLQLS